MRHTRNRPRNPATSVCKGCGNRINIYNFNRRKMQDTEGKIRYGDKHNAQCLGWAILERD